MTDRSEVSATQIARIAGVSRAAVSNWRKRHPGFPAPVGGSESSPTFSRQAVEDWLRAEGKLSEIPAGELLWRDVEAGSGSAGATAAVLAAVGEVLAASTSKSTSTAPTNAGQGLLDPALAAQVRKLAEAEGPDTLFEQLLGRYLDAYARDRDTGSVIEPLARLMAQLAQRADSDTVCVYDPSCGSGILLTAAARQGASSLVGQTAEAVLVPLVAARIALAGEGGGGGRAFAIQPGNALLADAHPELNADAVLCQPPTVQRDWGFDELPYDPRWEYGMPPRAESELAWVQHALARLRPGGTAVILLPPGVAARRPGRRIRAELLRRGALRAVIGLPAGCAAPFGLPLHLWVLRRPEVASPPPPNRLLFVDRSSAAGLAESDDTARHILTAWRTFEQAPDDHGGEPGFSAAPPVIELLDDAVDLSPGRHVPRPETGLGRAELLESRTTVESVLAQLAGLLPDLGPDPSPGPRWPMATLGDLARTQALTILTDTGIEEGDIVVPVLGGAVGQARAVAAEDPLIGTVAGRGVAALRPDPSLLDPWFVVGFLRSDAAARQSVSHASTMSRMDIRKVLLPRLPMDRQRAYAAAFRRIAEFGDALRQAADLGERLAQGITDALAEGSVLPDQYDS